MFYRIITYRDEFVAYKLNHEGTLYIEENHGTVLESVIIRTQFYSISDDVSDICCLKNYKSYLPKISAFMSPVQPLNVVRPRVNIPSHTMSSYQAMLFFISKL